MKNASKRVAAPRPDWSRLKSDAIAGLTTAVMLIPQAMAYAMLAGLPPIIGLYAAAVPLVAYAILGTSRELAVGPVAMDSLLTAATVGIIAQSGTDRYIELAALLALMAGAFQVVLGVLRGGFLVNFLSRPVVSGFTSAAALIIAASQLRPLLGLSLPRSSNVFEILVAAFSHVGDTHVLTACLSAGAMAGIWAMKKYAPKLPRALLVVVAGILLAGPAGLGAHGVQVVGEVPAGLPPFSLPDLNLADMRALSAGALTIAFVAFMEGISISTKLAERTGHRVDASREFLAAGAANIAAGLFSGYPVAGGLSRTAVNAEAGAKTKAAGLITAGVVAITLSFFTGLLHDVPQGVLGAIIVMAAVGLVDLKEPLRLWKQKRVDLWMLAATFVATLTLGIQQGILSGVLLSLLVLVVRTTQPHMALLGRIPGTEIYRNVKRFDDAEQLEGYLIVRLDAQLYFGNVSYLRDSLVRLEAEQSSVLRGVILDATGINQLDSSAEKALRDLRSAYEARGIRLVFAGVKGPVRDVMQRSGLLEELGSRGLVLRVHDAVKLLDEEAHAQELTSVPGTKGEVIVAAPETARGSPPSLPSGLG